MSFAPRNESSNSALTCGTDTAEELMKSPKEYREYAADCRRIAQTMKGEDKEKLLKIAEAWEKTAQEAERKNKV